MNENDHLLYRACKAKIFNLDIVEYLIKHGVNINEKGKYNPLQCACKFKKNEALVRCLIEHGVNINQEDDQGNTPIHLIAVHNHNWSCSNEKLAIEKYLERGSDLNIKNIYGKTPLIIACGAFIQTKI